MIINKINSSKPLLLAEHLSSYGRIYSIDVVEEDGLKIPVIYSEKFICPTIIAYTVSGWPPITFKGHSTSDPDIIENVTMRIGHKEEFIIGMRLEIRRFDIISYLQGSVPNISKSLDFSEHTLVALDVIFHHISHVHNAWLTDSMKMYGTRSSNGGNKLKFIAPVL